MKKDTKKTNTNNAIIFSILFYIVVTIVLIYFVIIPSIDYIKKTSISIIDQRIATDQYFENMNMEKKLEKDLDSIENELSMIDRFFIKKDQGLVDFIKDLEDLAIRNKIDQKSNINYDNICTDKYQKLSIKLNSSGNFKNTINYISELESMKYYINIRSIELIKSSANAAGSNSISNIEFITNTLNTETNINTTILLDVYLKEYEKK